MTNDKQLTTNNKARAAGRVVSRLLLVVGNQRITKKLLGYSLVETLIYVAILAFLLVSLLQAMNLMMRSWREAGGRAALASAGTLAMQRLSHDIREASSIDSAGSSFGIASSTLKLTKTDSAGVSTSTTFYATSSMLFVAQGSPSGATLLPPSVGVERFTVHQITTANSQAVRIILTLITATTTTPVRATLYNTAVLRGSY